MVVDLNQESPKDVISKALEAVEISRKTGKVKKGINEVTKVIERGVAKLVVLAKDVNPKEIIMHLPLLCDEKKVPLVIVSNKEELGAAVGLLISTSAVAVIAEGQAKELIQQLSV